MDNEHYHVMRSHSKTAINFAIKNNLSIDVFGASPNLIDLPDNIFKNSLSINFFDIDTNVLNSISKKLKSCSLKNVKYIKEDVSGISPEIKQELTAIYKRGLDSKKTIMLLIKYFDNLKLNFERDKQHHLLLSLNLISELQPPIRLFIEQLHIFYFQNLIEKSVSSKIFLELENANKRLYNKCILAHLSLSKYYKFSNYIISIYEDNKSYLDVFCNSPNDYVASSFISENLNLKMKPSYWNWKLSPSRKIRMMQFFVSN